MNFGGRAQTSCDINDIGSGCTMDPESTLMVHAGENGRGLEMMRLNPAVVHQSKSLHNSTLLSIPRCTETFNIQACLVSIGVANQFLQMIFSIARHTCTATVTPGIDNTQLKGLNTIRRLDIVLYRDNSMCFRRYSRSSSNVFATGSPITNANKLEAFYDVPSVIARYYLL